MNFYGSLFQDITDPEEEEEKFNAIVELVL